MNIRLSLRIFNYKENQYRKPIPAMSDICVSTGISVEPQGAQALPNGLTASGLRHARPLLAIGNTERAAFGSATSVTSLAFSRTDTQKVWSKPGFLQTHRVMIPYCWCLPRHKTSDSGILKGRISLSYSEIGQALSEHDSTCMNIA
jgi:hypothetical protein